MGSRSARDLEARETGRLINIGTRGKPRIDVRHSERPIGSRVEVSVEYAEAAAKLQLQTRAFARIWSAGRPRWDVSSDALSPASWVDCRSTGTTGGGGGVGAAVCCGVVAQPASKRVVAKINRRMTGRCLIVRHYAMLPHHPHAARRATFPAIPETP